MSKRSEKARQCMGQCKLKPAPDILPAILAAGTSVELHSLAMSLDESAGFTPAFGDQVYC